MKIHNKNTLIHILVLPIKYLTSSKTEETKNTTRLQFAGKNDFNQDYQIWHLN